MKIIKYIIFVFILLTFNIRAKALTEYVDFYKNWNFTKILPNSFTGGGGGSLVVEINNDILTINFSAGFSPSPLQTGYIEFLQTSPKLPDIQLGTIGGSYTAYITSGILFIASTQNENLTSVSENFTVDLSSLGEDEIPISSRASPSTVRNYVHTIMPQTDQGLEDVVVESVSYFDGLGRPDQLIQVGATPNRKDFIQAVEYDQLGRESKKYLPYAGSLSTGGYYTNETQVSNWTKHYGSSEDDYAFGEIVFDNSPLNRVVAQGAPGYDWRATGSHKVQIEYSTNHGTEVLFFDMNGDELRQSGNYSANQLYKTISKDENWEDQSTDDLDKLHTTEEFKDKLGQVVLKRSYVEDGDDYGTDIDVLDTYYVYDDFGLLRYVLPPKAVKEYGLNNSSSSDVKLIFGVESIDDNKGINTFIIEEGASLTLTSGFVYKATRTESLSIGTGTILSDICYSYRYDGRKRMIEKKLPGAHPVYMVYDNRDRLVATQDGNQRKDGKWLVTKYDVLNRPVLTGFYASDKNQDNLQKEVNSFYASTTNPMFESRGTVLKSYDNKSFPKTLSDADILTANYYGNYTFSHCPQSSYDATQVVNSDLLATPKGQLTGSWVKTLNADTGKPGGLWTVNFYDKKYRLVQSRSDNYLNGYDRMTNVCDFVGKVDRSIHEHKVGSSTTVENKWMTYDHAGRLTKVEQEYTGAVNKTRTTISEMVYDELGQLKNKKLTGAGRNLDYQYNIRGWLTNMNAHKQSASAGKGTDEFGFALNYNTEATSFGGQNQFNGNIGAMEWWSNGISKLSAHRQAYGYTYDALNRITNADFKTYNAGWKDDSGYDVTGITYDLNGNIRSLNRYDRGDHIDQLAYGYNGNQLVYVNDGKSETIGFKELSNSNSEYAYDANGNMISDKNKGISEVAYNLLNLPENISKGSKQIAYAYDATGVKHENRVSSTKKLQYLSNFVYENGSLIYILNEEGKLNVGDGSNTYQFFVKDHLGNTRLSVRENGTVEEINHYYPFGMRMAMGSPEDYTKGDANQKYLYNGKELQDETDWLDYGKRMFDPSIARWFNIDPRAEKYLDVSPYNYCINNPIKYVDPEGDTIALTAQLKENEVAIAAHEKWKKSENGQAFYKLFGKGGEFEQVSVSFGVDTDIVTDNGETEDAAGDTKTFAVDEDGNKTLLYTKASKYRSKLNNGEYLRFEINTNPGEWAREGTLIPMKDGKEYKDVPLRGARLIWYNGTIVTHKASTVKHEANHVRFFMNDLNKIGYIYYNANAHHYYMDNPSTYELDGSFLNN